MTNEEVKRLLIEKRIFPMFGIYDSITFNEEGYTLKYSNTNNAWDKLSTDQWEGLKRYYKEWKEFTTHD